MSAITPKQAAYLSFLGVKLPSTSSEASRLIQEAHETKDDSMWERCEMWKTERAWLHPDLYPDELHQLRAARLDAVYDFNNGERSIGCPLKKLTKAQVQKVIDYLDLNYSGWDRKFWLPLGCMCPNVFHDYFVAAAWHVDPGLFKKGYAPIRRCEVEQQRGFLTHEKGGSALPKKSAAYWWVTLLCFFAVLFIFIFLALNRGQLTDP